MDKDKKLDKEIEDLYKYVHNDLKLPIEKIGNWLWVDCTSASLSKPLEMKGFKFSKNKLLWYFTNRQAPSYRRPIPMDELRQIYSKNSLVVKK